jgi:hypothetical protein
MSRLYFFAGMSSLEYPKQWAPKKFSKHLSAASENLLRAIAKWLWRNIPV